MSRPLAASARSGAGTGPSAGDLERSYQHDEEAPLAAAQRSGTAPSSGSGGVRRNNMGESALTPRSRLSATLAEVPHIVSAFGLWAPIYIAVFTGACFLLAFALGRHSGAKAIACDGGLHGLLLLSSAALFVWMLVFMVRDVREQRRSMRREGASLAHGASDAEDEDEDEDDDDEEPGFDWLIFVLRIAFMLSMAALALWGHHVLTMRAAQADKDTAALEQSGGNFHADADSSSGASLPFSCAGRDEDLVTVCWWLVVLEGVAAAVAAGVAIAQAVAAYFDW